MEPETRDALMDELEQLGRKIARAEQRQADLWWHQHDGDEEDREANEDERLALLRDICDWEGQRRQILERFPEVRYWPAETETTTETPRGREKKPSLRASAPLC
jgi:hypothetical protein